VEIEGSKFGSDVTDNDIECEWKAWEIPIQDQLDQDLKYPRNKRKAYIGDEVEVETVTRDIVDEMQAFNNTLTTVDGDEVSRYTSVWTDWILESDIHVDAYIAGQSSDREDYNMFPIDFSEAPYSLTEIDSSRLSVYINGIQLAPSEVEIDGTEVSIVTDTLPNIDGVYRVHILYRKYQPTEEDLEFDPDNRDDLRIQTRYKKDYQYTEVKTRDLTGNQITSKYYFWVKDKTI